MNTRHLSLAGSLMLLVSGEALAQVAAVPAGKEAAAPFAASDAVGHWLYGPQGNIVGSVRKPSDDGQTVEIMVGSYFQIGSHAASIPSNALARVGGKVVLRSETVEALNTAARR